MEKNPEDRYQNCFGLALDIQECLAQLEEHGKINAFELGKHDISPVFSTPQILAGRETEIELLVQAVERIGNPNAYGELLLVSGRPGIGKSSLINEARKLVIPKKGYFISGKYNQFRKDAPYSAIVQAFQGLVHQILAESAEKLTMWKTSLLIALGPNGKIITDIIPEMELIIGVQPYVPDLTPEQNQNRFNYVFENFVAALVSQSHPLVLFVDDLQWADVASLNLIELILTNDDINHLLLVGSFRDNEVSEFHPMQTMLNNLKRNNLPVNNIYLEVLNLDNVTEVVSLFLRCSHERALPLAETVQKKTNGNPFFVNLFMNTLYEEALLVLDTESGWKWKIDDIEQVELTDNVVELLAKKIEKMPQSTKELLKVCSCIGNRFELDFLSRIYDRSFDLILKELTVANNEGILKRQGTLYLFQHDRIQEAVYSLIPDKDKELLHYRVGQLMLSSLHKTEQQDELLYILDQLNMGRRHVSSEQERETLAQMNLQGGQKAKQSAAYQSALIYFKKGISLLNTSASSEMLQWDLKYELLLSLYSDACEAAYLSCDYKELDILADAVFSHAKTHLDKIKVYCIKINACMAQNKLVEALDLGLTALNKIGIKFPQKPSTLNVILGLGKTAYPILRKGPGELLKLPEMESPLMQGGIKLLTAIASVAYWIQPDLQPLIIFKTMEITLRYGITPSAPYIICGYGFILCVLGKIDAGFKFGNAGLELLERFDTGAQPARAHFVMNTFIRHWKEHLKETEEPINNCVQKGMETGDYEFVG
ncbi:MAG: AAA family ATPase, partial [Desulfobacterales bacterium]|nr:AAA family ATPase [Desulfobacterales bacterium]